MESETKGNAPQRAIVKPRVISPRTGEVVPLDVVVQLIQQHDAQRVHIVGGAGSGKTTALAHLATLPQASKFIFVDDEHHGPVPTVPRGKTLFQTSRRATNGDVFQLAPWTEDDLIEYMLSTAPESCGFVIEKFRTDPHASLLAGNPQLTCLVINELLTHLDSDIRAALIAGVQLRVPNEHIGQLAQQYAFAALITKESLDLQLLRGHSELFQLLQHEPVRLLFAAQHLTQLLRHGQPLPKQLPTPLLFELAEAIHSSPHHQTCVQELQRSIKDDRHRELGAPATILQALGVDWLPADTKNLNLSKALFEAADWNGRNLAGVRLTLAKLNQADLRDANLEEAELHSTEFVRANLRAANLKGASVRNANFTRAILQLATISQTNLQGCIFRSTDMSYIIAQRCNFLSADLTNADLTSAVLDVSKFDRATFDSTNLHGADLSHAHMSELDLRSSNLDFADMKGAVLRRCNFEGIEIEQARFHSALLGDALFTGSKLNRVDLQDVELTGAGLADINWTTCDLRKADFTNCSFHLGSTRCGLVGSPYPSHGTRTGFYTDDFDSHLFRRPEEVRKAALCGCDLRGANVWETDFYLVDLRGAKYHTKQEAHFRRCKAILGDWDGEH